MPYSASVLLAISDKISLPDDIAALLGQVEQKITGLDEKGKPATWYYWPNGTYWHFPQYDPLKDFLSELDTKHFGYCECGEGDTNETDGDPERYRMEIESDIVSPFDDIFANFAAAKREWNKEMPDHTMPFQTKVVVEYFHSGKNSKSYISDTYYSNYACCEGPEITEEVRNRFPMAKDMNHTIEVWNLRSAAWNKWLKIVDFPKPEKVEWNIEKHRSAKVIIDDIRGKLTGKCVPNIARPETTFENQLLDQNFEANYAGPKDALLEELPYYSRPGNRKFQYLFTAIEDYFQDWELAIGPTVLENNTLIQTSDRKIIKRFDISTISFDGLLILLNDIESDLWRIVNEDSLEEEYRDQLIDNADHKYTVLLKRYSK